MNVYEVSLLSSDSGFSVKDQDTPVTLPASQIYKIKYEDKYGRQLDVAGDWVRISRTLRKAGYKVIQQNACG
jgi:hypothetical protein